MSIGRPTLRFERRVGSQPQTNRLYWHPKLARNRDRAVAGELALIERGWTSLIIWECETRDESMIALRLRRFLGCAAADE